MDGRAIPHRYRADVTVLGPVVSEAMQWDLTGSSQQLGGIDGDVNSTIVSTQIQFYLDDGLPVTFRGSFHAIHNAQHLEMSVLGRDIIEMFALIVDRPGDVVCLLRENHRYEIQEAT